MSLVEVNQANLAWSIWSNSILYHLCLIPKIVFTDIIDNDRLIEMYFECH